MNTAIEFLTVAKSDLKAAQCLYDSELYPHTVFFLQQAIEKSAKAYGLLSPNITLDILKHQIRHSLLKIFIYNIKKLIEEHSKNEFTHNILLKTSNNEQDEDKSSIAVQQLHNMLNLCERIEGLAQFTIAHNLSAVLERIKNPDWFTKNDPEVENILKPLEESLNGPDDLVILSKKEALVTILKEIMSKTLKIGNLIGFLVSAIPPSCAENTRYPSEKSTPLNIYTDKNLLIKRFNDITEVCHFTIMQIDELVDLFFRMETSLEQIL